MKKKPGSAIPDVDLCGWTPIEVAAYWLWRAKRPVGWTASEQIAHPQINSYSDEYKALADLVAAKIEKTNN